MGKWMRSAIQRQNSFTFNSSCSPAVNDHERLEQWTMAELRREYERFNPAYNAEGGSRHGQTSPRTGEAHHWVDLERDAMFEQLIALVGSQADELLRFLQNR
ncbi:Fur-regulated basic protein FbpA [Bacillus megaterium]|nr:Fur-regulated basic protein FbpA [Priestia megaterium]